MIDDKIIRALEFDKVLERVSEYAVLETSKEELKNLRPVLDFTGASLLLKKTEEADRLMYKHGVSQIDYFDPIEEEFDRLRLGGTLSMRQLLKIARLLKSSRLARSGILYIEDDIELLKQTAGGLYSDQNLEKDITSKIISEEAMHDRASDALYDIRQRIRKLNEQIREKLQSFIKKDASGYLQDGIVTMRGDRYVVPVKAEYKNQVKGFIHDRSSSGSTLFVEPEAVLELNNELKLQTLLEEAEIDRILSELSREAASVRDALMRNIELLSDLDICFAKAVFGYKNRCSMPVLNSAGVIEIKRGRHPLIDRERVVPIDVRLGDGFKFLLVTGPNTGGKTVTLKLTGLFTLMAMCGLYVPAAEGTRLSVFESIFCDVGDEQSIEQSLSTFSSHMTNIVKITRQTDEKSLVLIDEIGAGTDPEEGAALALALIKFFLEKGASGIITTHYQSLKEYAFTDHRIENASMEFNPFTYAPVYKINIGLPGSSNAIEISKRLGLSKDIVQAAFSNLSGQKVAFEHVLRKAEETRQDAAREKEELLKLKREREEELESIKQERKKLIEERDRLQKTSKVEMRRLIGERMYEAEELVEQIKDILDKAELTSGDLIKARTLKNKLEDKKYGIEQESEYKPVYKPLLNPKKGDKAYIKSIDGTGIVESVNEKKGETSVLVGQMHMNVKTKDLYISDGAPIKSQSKGVLSVNVERGKQETPSSGKIDEINLLGLTVADAIMDTDAFLDRAVLMGLSEVRIIHGVGTGRLKAAINEHLKGHPSVKSYRFGKYGEGEKGVTIATLK